MTQTGAPHGPLHEALRAQVQAQSFGAVAHLLRRLLAQMGYTGVRVRRTQSRGRNAFVAGERAAGGWDIEAEWEAGLTRQRLIVQLKHDPGRTVQLRCVDELRGALARAQAHHGLLVTTGAFSPQARQAAGARDDLALVDGEGLARLLADWRVGLRQTPGGAWEVDLDLLRRLARQFPGQQAPGPSGGEPPRQQTPDQQTPDQQTPAGGGPPRRGLTVIVSVRR
ncbi:MAG: restriction endonuclease [Armatimonadetes bacterium]|nr:restriction endonuclease [Armatimonadota bacterium]